VDRKSATAATVGHRGSYLEELHVALVVALVVICIALGIVGWKLHPASNGFQLVPQAAGPASVGKGPAITLDKKPLPSAA
jgi:hypothetical protein